MHESPTVVVARTKYVPRSRPDDRYLELPLIEALATAWPSDAHVSQHGACHESPCFEKKQRVVCGESPLSLVTLLADYDLNHDDKLSSEALEWRCMQALAKLPPGWIGYRTGGGFRALALLPQPFVVDSPETWELWTAFYKGTVLALDAVIGEVGDQKCGNPDRCFRLPNVVRDGGKASYPALYGALGYNGLVPVPVPLATPAQPIAGLDWVSALQAGDSDAEIIGKLCQLPALGTGDTACAFVAGALAAAGVSDERAERMLGMFTQAHGYTRDAERDLRRARAGLFRASAPLWVGRLDKAERQPTLDALRAFTVDLARTVDPVPAELLGERAGITDATELVVDEQGGNGVRTVALGSEESLGREIMAGGEWCADYGTLYRAEAGVWSEVSESEVYRALVPYDGAPRMRTKQNAKSGLWEIKQEGHVIVSARFATGVRNSMMRAQDSRGFFDESPVGVAFSNGFVGADGVLVPLTPEHRQRDVLPYEYIPDASLEQDAPMLRHLLDDWFGLDDDDQDAEQKAALVCEFAGLGMIGGFGPRFQTAVILYGEGHNGKSVVIEIIRRLVPRAYQCSIPPQLMGDQQSLAQLAGKRVNICAEIPEHEVVESGNLKQIISCDDGVEAKVVYQPKFFFRPKAGHMFSCNNLPGFRDHTKGFLRRWLFVHFAREVSAEKRRPLDELVDGLLASEGAGVASYLVAQGLAAYARGSLTVPAVTTLEAKDEWRKDADPVYDFAKACLVPCGMLPQRDWGNASELFDGYRLWCTATGHTFKLTARKFKKRLLSQSDHREVIAGGKRRLAFRLRFELEPAFGGDLKLPPDWADVTDGPADIVPIDTPAMRASYRAPF